MSTREPLPVIGCLLDVSGSMNQALESGRSDEKAGERLRAVLRAALKLAQAEQRRDRDALMFVGVFGLKSNDDCPPVIDLCGALDALLKAGDDQRSGHELLISLATQHNFAHIAQYIETKLTDNEARVVYTFLKRHPERLDEFMGAIPPPEQLQRRKAALDTTSLLIEMGMMLLFGEHGVRAAILQEIAADAAENSAIENSKALKLARKICTEWLVDFQTFEPGPIKEIVSLMERLEKHAGDEQSKPPIKKESSLMEQILKPACGEQSNDDTMLETLRQHMYGDTPIREALVKCLAAFQKHPNTGQRVLMLISDGESTDGDPLPVSQDLKEERVTISAVYLTSDKDSPRRCLYDSAPTTWGPGQRTLFDMATRASVVTHPIPVLASMGWKVPSSGECALYTSVCSTAALDEFCTILLSARFGSADALLDIVGRVRLDAYINDEHVRTHNDPSDQGQSMTCYAHAIAAVVHMALLRIVGREEGFPSIEEIRTRILTDFPPRSRGRVIEEVLGAVLNWYRPLRFRKTDEEGARQAVLHRRPVLTTFHLSRPGWKTFKKHFTREKRSTVLQHSQMLSHRSLPSGGGHAVVLISCDPCSLTFLNSWGHQWGVNGSFSIEDHNVLEMDGASESLRMRFYDVYWLENDLTAAEKQAYDAKADEIMNNRATDYPSILELEARCTQCHKNAPIADFKGSIRKAICPLCQQSFMPEPGDLVKALYARAGINEVA